MKKLICITTVTVLAAFTSVNAAEAELKARSGDSKLKVEADADLDADAKVRGDVDTKDAAASANAQINDDVKAVQNSNKASSLLGMEVRNPNNQKLGEIKDVVLDLKSGKVNYAVLAAGGFLGIGEKLLAVPVRAFNVSEDQSYLLLNADKAKIQAAVGFPATNWPNPDDQKISSYWLTPDTGAGAPARTETDREARGVRTDIEMGDRRLEVNVDADKNEKLYTEPKDTELKAEGNVDIDRDRKSISARADADLDNTRNANWKMLEGEVRSVDSEDNVIVIQTREGQTKQVHMDNQTVMRLGKEQVVRLNDYKPGYPLRIEYEMRDGKLVARRIIKTDAP